MHYHALYVFSAHILYFTAGPPDTGDTHTQKQTNTTRTNILQIVGPTFQKSSNIYNTRNDIMRHECPRNVEWNHVHPNPSREHLVRETRLPEALEVPDGTSTEC